MKSAFYVINSFIFKYKFMINMNLKNLNISIKNEILKKGRQKNRIQYLKKYI